MTESHNLRMDLHDETDRLRRQKVFLEDFMDPDYGLLDQLLEMGALSRREIHDVKSERTFEARNSRIVEYISKHKRFGQFVLALRNTNQRHIANYLTSDGVNSGEFGDEWPLDEKQTAALNRNQLIVVDALVHIDSLSLCMFSACIINKRHKETIRSQPTDHEKSEVILDMIARQSQENYTKTIDCLHESLNDHVVKMLNSPGVVVKVTTNIETSGSESETLEIERNISTTINDILRNESPEEQVEHISELQPHGFIGAKFGHSVALYFNCESLERLDNLWKLKKSGLLKDDVEKYFNRVMPTEHSCKVRLKWSADDYAVKKSILNEVTVQKMSLSEVEPTCSRSARVTEVASTPSVGILKAHARLYGVTKLNNLIYVLCRAPNAVYVYSDQHPFEQESVIEIDTAGSQFEGYDISACSQSSCLYVSDACIGRIYKIALDDTNQVISWLKNLLHPPWTLSVCRTKGNVLIARNEEPVRLEVYNPEAEIILSVKLAADAATLRHAAETSDGRFIVIHKWKDSGAWGLSEVNRKGETVRCFKSEEKSKKSLCNPCHLALDDDDRVIVLDQMRKQVVRFDHDLKWQAVVSTREELQQPLRLCYDTEKRQLIVGQENGLVGIYSI